MHSARDLQTRLRIDLAIPIGSAIEPVPHAHVQFWLVPGATHAQGFHVAGQAYVRRVIAFLRTSLSAPSPSEKEEAGG